MTAELQQRESLTNLPVTSENYIIITTARPRGLPRNRAIVWPAGLATAWPRGGRATTPPHNHAAAQPRRRTADPRHPRCTSATVAPLEHEPTLTSVAAAGLSERRPAPCLRHQPPPHPVSARIGPPRTLSPLASAPPHPVSARISPPRTLSPLASTPPHPVSARVGPPSHPVSARIGPPRTCLRSGARWFASII